MNTRALVLGAGLGSRLGSLTENHPKPLLDVGGKPLLEHTLGHLGKLGIRDVAVNIYFQAEKMRAFLKDTERLGVNVTVFEEKAPSGTAGGVAAAHSFLEQSEDFLVLYGDLLANPDHRNLVQFRRDRGALGALYVHQRQTSNSAVDFAADGRVERFLERPPAEVLAALPKPLWVNSGIYCFSREIFSFLGTPPQDLPRDIFPPLIERSGLYALPYVGYRCAIDSLERYEQACMAVRSGQVFAEGSL